MKEIVIISAKNGTLYRVEKTNHPHSTITFVDNFSTEFPELTSKFISRCIAEDIIKIGEVIEAKENYKLMKLL
jgi:hypothetical protein